MSKDTSMGGVDEQAWVGPILTNCAVGVAVAEAILQQNPNGTVIDRGAYLRVLVPGRCVLRTNAVEATTGAEFVLPSALEAVMPSFQGRLRWSDGEVEWA